MIVISNKVFFPQVFVVWCLLDWTVLSRKMMQSDKLHRLTFFPFPATQQHSAGTLFNKATKEFDYIPLPTLSLE